MIAATALADNKGAGQAFDAVELFARDHADDPAPGLLSQGDKVHVHAGQSRAGGFGHDAPVVKADHADAGGNVDPAVAERVKDAARDLVIAGDDAVGGGCGIVKQGGDGGAPPGFGP